LGRSALDLSFHTIAGAIQRADPMTFEMRSKAKPAGDWTEPPTAIRQLQQSWQADFLLPVVARTMVGRKVDHFGGQVAP